LFGGLFDTLQVLRDVLEEKEEPPGLAQLQKDVESAYYSPPVTLIAARFCLDALTLSATELLSTIDTAGIHTENQAGWWARAFTAQCRAARDELTLLVPLSEHGTDGIPTLRELARGGNDGAAARITALERLALQSGELSRMEYEFLFDRASHLLAIGYNVDGRRRDTSYYDLLASEARLCSFTGIAQGQLPQESWFALGRLLTNAGGEPVLVSWSGSMFEYLMPLLVMPTYERTLLDETCRAAVARQIEYGRERGVAWGVSESGFNTIDAQQNYQYRAFGVPGLGLKRGLADDLVVAPYASALALMVAPEEACLNLQRLASEGAEGQYGFYEAIDHTPSRLQRGQSSVVIRSFMAHHVGMSFLSLAYLLLDRPMQKRFESDPLFQATMLLLQERVPRATAFYSQIAERSESYTASPGTETTVRVFTTPDTLSPQVQLLSNGRYHVMVTNAGGGYSSWKDLVVTRWQEDSTRDDRGTFCYIRDAESGEFWSTAHQPALKQSKKYEAIFSEGRAEFRRQDHDLESHTEIAVSPEDDIELRRITITNRGRKRRTIDVTSYAEVVLAPPAADALHPAFSNLFVQTEIVPERQAILCTRRPRSRDEHAPWMFHLMAVHGAETGEASYETDRLRFLGRGRTAADPEAMDGPGVLSGSSGSVLDPIVAIRYRITLDPEKPATINIVTGIGENRDSCMGLVGKYQDWRLADRVFDLAWTHSQVLLRQINATEADAQLYGRLAGSILYANASLRADPGVILRNRRGQSGLWGYSISGDLPIVLLRIEDPENIELVRRLVQAHAYWRLKGLAVDLVIWNEDHAGYRQVLQEQILGLIAAGVEANVTERPGGIFVRPVDQISNEDRILLQTVARAIISDSLGPLEDQVSRRALATARAPRLVLTGGHSPALSAAGATARKDLLFFNGLGGFTADGREYIITTADRQQTPAPWVNVIANPHFGTVISESGAAYTWSENAHEFRLTPWNNDPISDPGGEAFFLRDDENGHFWSPTPLPRCGAKHYVTRHGFGYSVFEHVEDGISSEVWVYVAMDATIKFTAMTVKNLSDRPRRLSAFGYVEWVLGDLRPKTSMQVITEIDPKTGAIFARNPYNSEFSHATAFFDAGDTNRTVTGDRTEFLGRNGALRSPAAMTRARLSGRVGAALDPCAAIQVPCDLAVGQEREIIFRLGAGRSSDDAGSLVRRFRTSAAARGALEKVWEYWSRTLGAVQVETPDRSVNMLANGWLLYQTLACRLWARSGFYQSGGAFGFRDQLQDVMALVYSEPRLVREHLLLCAAHQFREGDVQHWWHPPTGRGVRTRCSDDFLWLPLAACRYVLTTGDTGVLDETVRFVEGRPLNPDEDSYYDLPHASEDTTSLYDHCVRAILNGLNRGEHGLPLMGSGDWNDGMNLVGRSGKGESVWLGFFLYAVLARFSEIALLHGDPSFAERCRKEAEQVRGNIEEHGWDGEWYRRAYFDDGSPLGSAGNPECRIDSIAQSWAVLSGAGDAERSRTAMDAVDRLLVQRDHKLVQLLDPPFDTSDLDPGYIKGYVPGVRENGGQYTHAAVWTAMAFAALGDNSRAWELLTMINPINHARSPEETAIYKGEPYVAAADVYAAPPHIGRGGWTWYTGSAGWMYRLIVESLLGLRLETDKLRFEPCLPGDWETFKVHYQFRETMYHITVVQLGDNSGEIVIVDGVKQGGKALSLVDDRQEHAVEVRIQRGSSSPCGSTV
jgi:cellobiose phosphorylase